MRYRSDAHAGYSGNRLYEEFKSSIQDYRLALERILPFVTSNTATALKLEAKGQLREGADGDVLVMRADTLDIVHLFARGRHMVKNGQMIA